MFQKRSEQPTTESPEGKLIHNRYKYNIKQGDYDYCRVPGTRQLSPLEGGEDNSNFKHKKIEKN